MVDSTPSVEVVIRPLKVEDMKWMVRLLVRGTDVARLSSKGARQLSTELIVAAELVESQHEHADE